MGLKRPGSGWRKIKKKLFCTILILEHCERDKICYHDYNHVSDYNTANYGASSINECMKFCKQTQGCNYYEWASNSNCWLYENCDRIGGKYFYSNIISHIDCNKE